jgi:hypothetical protein
MIVGRVDIGAKLKQDAPKKITRNWLSIHPLSEMIPKKTLIYSLRPEHVERHSL